MDPLKIEYETIDDVPEAFQPLYSVQGDKAVLTGVDGVKTQADIDRLQEALRKERNDRKELDDRLKPWSRLGDDPDEIASKLDRIAELEAAAGDKLDEEGINKLVEGRLAQKTGPLERKLSELTEQLTAVDNERNAAISELTNFKMSLSIRDAAAEAGVVPSAIPDIEIIARNMLEYDEQGNLITRDGVGVTPGVNLKQFFKEMTQSRPHWFPESEGGGAGGGRGGGGAAGNPWTSKGWSLTEQGRILREQGRDVAERMAKSAGVTLGATKPKA